ncbi:MAG: inositol phosphorylceramide synthase [Methanosarcinaceae archaeon]|nr:inositol phosphorylceramide synthase [Methanosarcinaceae archaeon]
MSAIALMTIIVPVVVLLNFIAYYLLVPRKYRSIYDGSAYSEKLGSFFSYSVLPYFLIVSSVYLLVKLEVVVTEHLNITPYYRLAEFIFSMEGHTVSSFQTIMSPTLTYFSAFIYLFGFSFLLIFTFVVLVCTGKVSILQEYSIAVVLAYLISFPFYIFTPVKVTGYTLPTVIPLLYELSPIISEGLRSVDPHFDNCFPSLHAALSIIAMLLIVLRTDLKELKMVVVILALLIQFTIFYLGIHWIIDFIGGILLALLCYYVATRYRERIVRKMSIICGFWKD